MTTDNDNERRGNEMGCGESMGREIKLLRDGGMEGCGVGGERQRQPKTKIPRKTEASSKRKCEKRNSRGVYESKSFLLCFFFLLPH